MSLSKQVSDARSSSRHEEVTLAGRMHAEMNATLATGHRPGRQHWLACDREFLIKRLREELDELIEAGPEDVWREASDVANFAAMIADLAVWSS